MDVDRSVDGLPILHAPHSRCRDRSHISAYVMDYAGLEMVKGERAGCFFVLTYRYVPIYILVYAQGSYLVA